MIFDADFHKVKLIDFGMTRRCGSYVRRLVGSIPYSPPEVCDAINNDILVSTAMDVWALAVLLFCSLTGLMTIELHLKIIDFLLLLCQAIFLGNMPKKAMFIIMNIYNGNGIISYIDGINYHLNGIDLVID